MAHSLESILADEPNLDSLPDSADDTADEVSEPEEKSTPASVTPAVEAAHKPAAATEDDESEDDVPDDVERLKKALAAARGDRRKARKKWQEAEKQLARFEGRIEGQRTAAEKQPAKVQDPKDLDTEYWENPTEFVSKRLRETQQSISEQVQTELYLNRLAVSQTMVADKPDYAEAESAFMEAVQAAPHLREQILRHPAPAVFAYQTGRAYLVAKDAGGDIDALERKIEERVRAKIAAESRASGDQVSSRPRVPKTLADARGSGVSAKSTWAGARSLEEILA